MTTGRPSRRDRVGRGGPAFGLVGAAGALAIAVAALVTTLVAPAFGADPPAARAAAVPPPQLYVEAPGRVAAGAAFDVFVSSSVPASLEIAYGDQLIEAVEQDLRVALTGLGGTVPLEVRATDAAGRAAEERLSVVGLRIPEPVLEAAPTATVGDALAVRLRWRADGAAGDPAALATVADAWIELDGEALSAHAFGDGLLALAPIALASAPGPRTLQGVVVDEFGIWHRATASLEVAPNPHPIQQLSIPASVLAVSTNDGRELEARTLETAFAAVGPSMRWEEPFLLPIQGRGTSGFGLPRRYGPGGNVSFHLGTDIAAPEGTPIQATNGGVVLVAGQYPIKGGLVILDHGFGVTSLYFHQSRIAVEVGDVVARGDVVGYVGSTGLSTGPHLHWEMRVDGVPTDPMAWVGRVVPNAVWASP